MGREKELPKKVPFYKLFTFADRWDVMLMIVGSLAAIGNGLVQPLLTLILGQIINTFGHSDPQNVVHQVSKISLKFVYLAIYSCAVCFLQVTCWIITGERQSTRIRGMYLRTILRQDIAFFDTETNTGEIIGRMSGDTVLIQEAMGEKVGKFIQLIATFVGGFTIAFIKGWRLSVVLLACIPALVIAGGIMAMLSTKMAGRVQMAYAEAGNVVNQTVSSIRTVASYTGEKDAIRKYDSKVVLAYKAAMKQWLATGIGQGSLLFIIFGTYGIAVWYGARLIIEKNYTGGQVINVIIAMMTGGMSLGQTSPSLNAFGSGKSAAYKMFETIKRIPRIDASSMEGIVSKDLRGEIELKDVHFSYPARPDVQIFAGVSLHIPSGTSAALVGQSGSGKSTVISLVERFYDPDSGVVLIDGVDLKKFKLNWIRQKIGLVSQEPILFTTTIRENIAYGKEDATYDEIRTAMQLSNAAKFIDKLPKGIDTMVGEHGTQLSGGQKQRIAIARAILKNPRILLLDEATSALDAESERIVQDALDRVMTNRTTLIVAHRLTTIKNADTIAVVHQGKIVEKGSHEELVKDPEGAYSQLIRLQEGAYRKEATLTDPTIPGTSRSISQRSSMRRSASRGSSSGRQTISLSSCYSVHGYVDIPEERDNDDDDDDHDVSDATKSGIKEQETYKSGDSFRRLAKLNFPELPILLLGAVGASAYGITFPVFGYLLSSAIRIFYEPVHLLRKDSQFWALIFVSLGLVALIAIPIQHFFFGMAGGKLIRRIRLLTFEKIVHQEIKWFDDPANSSGAIGARLAVDGANIRGVVGEQLALIVQNAATIIAGLVIAFTANWILSFVVLVLVPLIFMQGYLQAKFMKGFSADAKMMYEEASQVASDAVGSIRTVASFCAEERVVDFYDKKCKGPVKNGVRMGLISGLGFGFSFLALYCTNAICYYIGAVLIHHGKATFAEVFRVFFALSISAIGLSQSSSLAMDRSKALESAASIFKILDTKSSIDSSSDEGTTLETVRGVIQFDHVNFKYPTRPDIQIFKDLSLVIPSKKTVALVGESGCGKSTVIAMIERFYEPDIGKVLLDGVEIQKLKLSWLRQQMGLVSQEPVLFNDTIRANIAYGKQGDATENEIIAAAKSANAHNFISALPQGYDTSAGERGVQLSGGQKQRIAIARAILKNPRILLLDEATSALDAESERIVQNALDSVTVNRTTVVVAHRLSTIKNADIIAVVKNGVIAEKGKHDELMEIAGGAYASLVALHSSTSNTNSN